MSEGSDGALSATEQPVCVMSISFTNFNATQPASARQCSSPSRAAVWGGGEGRGRGGGGVAGEEG